LEPFIEQVRRLVPQIEAVTAGKDAPTLTLNRHCGECEFRGVCQSAAEGMDDLSLLRGMSAKEVEKQRQRGITTVTQFSHTYRPGRRGKRRPTKGRKHDHALQALALREQKVYIFDKPQVPSMGTALYLDVEGIPDEDRYYLVGLLAVEDGRCTSYSFWADDQEQEQAMWTACAGIISGFEEYTLYHYGQYEQRFLDHMRQVATEDGAAAIDQIRARSCNVLAAIYSHVYFPTRSNSLKEVGVFLAFQWSAENASGIQSLAWRLAWEMQPEDTLKQHLIQYNREDCQALRRVTEFLLSVCAGTSQGGTAPNVASADSIGEAGHFHFGKQEFFCPELAQINKCAYSDYQREKVYLRTCPAMRQSLRRKLRACKRRLRVNEWVECGRPACCPECGCPQVYSFGKRWHQKRIFDLKFTAFGVKRWVVMYRTLRYWCGRCRKTFHADEYRSVQGRFGPDLCSWAVYHHVALRQTFEDVTLSLNEIFGFSFSYEILKRIKPLVGKQHKETYDRIKGKLRRGALIHADETKVKVKGHAGYVWAFTNMEEVLYVYTSTREGTILDDVLDGFKGVLISDFYSAYDSPKCPQQKCLIHLIRDINDDLFHNPFDEELKQLAQRWVAVLKPIIDTIDRYGLKRCHLGKHKRDVGRYFSYLSEQAFHSELARKYQKRVDKYKGKLFTFLDHDGIPWNNNNAENAIKRFASRRKIIGASFTDNGIHDYLTFLSIYQTCRHKNVSFLRFLRSGTFDIDTFVSSGGR
jgi:hypothetical protein